METQACSMDTRLEYASNRFGSKQSAKRLTPVFDIQYHSIKFKFNSRESDTMLQKLMQIATIEITLEAWTGHAKCINTQRIRIIFLNNIRWTGVPRLRTFYKRVSHLRPQHFSSLETKSVDAKPLVAHFTSGLCILGSLKYDSVTVGIRTCIIYDYIHMLCNAPYS